MAKEQSGLDPPASVYLSGHATIIGDHAMEMTHFATVSKLSPSDPQTQHLIEQSSSSQRRSREPHRPSPPCRLFEIGYLTLRPRRASRASLSSSISFCLLV